MSTGKVPILIGNWKMHKTSREAHAFIAQLLPHLRPSLEVMLAIPYTTLGAAVAAAHSSLLLLGAQNVSDLDEGPVTGEISAHMLWEEGARFVLIGHSERRALFHEEDALINRKMRKAQGRGLLPVLCVGETLEERERGATQEVLARQLARGLAGIAPQRLLVAYEPVWAIGTGRTATPAIAEEAHLFCRAQLGELWESESASQVPLLYGGSVTAGHIGALLEQDEIDGALIGGASLDIGSLLHIMEAADPTRH